MRIKQLFANLVMIFALSALFLSAPVTATGEEEPELPEQSQTPEAPDETGDVNDSSSDNSSIGGGLNVDNEDQTTPDKPTQSGTPSISKPLPQPADPDAETQRPATTPSVTTSKPTPPTVVLKPQSQSSRPSTTTTPAVSITETTNIEEALDQVVTIPTAPNDSIAPAEIEAPRTGLIEPQTAPVNPLAIIMLVLAGVAIASAGIISTLLSKAGRRSQSAI